MKRETVGHLVLSKPVGDGPPVMGFGDDWKVDLLGKEKIPALISGQSEEWIGQLAQQLADEDSAVFHVYVTPRPEGVQNVDFFDCACKSNPKTDGVSQ